MNAMIEVEDLRKCFYTPGGEFRAVGGASLSIQTGRTMGIVGESGCGKLIFRRTIAHLLKSTSGKIYFEEEDITRVNNKKPHELREKMQITFQDPCSSLNPRYTVSTVTSEPLILSKWYSKIEIRQEVEKMVNLIRIDRRLMNSYPHKLDGGWRQRIGTARALALGPKFIVYGEPVLTLDVSIQVQVLSLLMDLRNKKNLTYMLTTHDLPVVWHISDDVSVIYLGQLVETNPSKELSKQPLHPYTKVLPSVIPMVDVHATVEREVLHGEIVSPISLEPGCRFVSRCKYVCEKCSEPQTLRRIEPNHFVSCRRVEEINS